MLNDIPPFKKAQSVPAEYPVHELTGVLCSRDQASSVPPNLQQGSLRSAGLPVEQLAELNHLEDPNFIEAGAQILVTFPGQFVEELSQYVPTHPGGGQQWEVHIKKVRERRVVRKKVSP